MRMTSRVLEQLLRAVAVVGVMYPATIAAQVDKPADLSNGPAKPGFDITRFSSAGKAIPAALFVDSKNAKVQGKEIRLDNGAVIRSGAFVDHRGKRQAQQIFTRWYGFALTFPGSEVFGQQKNP